MNWHSANLVAAQAIKGTLNSDQHTQQTFLRQIFGFWQLQVDGERLQRQMLPYSANISIRCLRHLLPSVRDRHPHTLHTPYDDSLLLLVLRYPPAPASARTHMQ